MANKNRSSKYCESQNLQYHILCDNRSCPYSWDKISQLTLRCYATQTKKTHSLQKSRMTLSSILPFSYDRVSEKKSNYDANIRRFTTKRQIKCISGFIVLNLTANCYVTVPEKGTCKEAHLTNKFGNEKNKSIAAVNEYFTDNTFEFVSLLWSCVFPKLPNDILQKRNNLLRWAMKIVTIQ
jgi:hypothetical protein